MHTAFTYGMPSLTALGRSQSADRADLDTGEGLDRKVQRHGEEEGRGKHVVEHEVIMATGISGRVL
jgi:hypothetical protein